jgi:hypothetical protein
MTAKRALKPVRVHGHEIPAHAKCYCVSRHVPTYAYVFPWELPDGRILYLCPNTYQCVKILLEMRREVGGAPSRSMLWEFPLVAIKLSRLHFRMELDGIDSETALRNEKLHRLKDRDG